jgi:hypothetical protein
MAAHQSAEILSGAGPDLTCCVGDGHATTDQLHGAGDAAFLDVTDRALTEMAAEETCAVLARAAEGAGEIPDGQTRMQPGIDQLQCRAQMQPGSRLVMQQFGSQARKRFGQGTYPADRHLLRG